MIVATDLAAAAGLGRDPRRPGGARRGAIWHGAAAAAAAKLPAHRGGRTDAPATPATPAELHAAAACLIGRNPAAADALLATAPYSAAERQQAVRLLGEMQRCLAPAGADRHLGGAGPRRVRRDRLRGPLHGAAGCAHDPALAVKPLLQPALVASGTDAAALAPEYAPGRMHRGPTSELVIAPAPDRAAHAGRAGGVPGASIPPSSAASRAAPR